MSDLVKRLMPRGLSVDWDDNYVKPDEAQKHYMWNWDLSCPKCSCNAAAQVKRLIAQNGVTQYRLVCPSCDYNIGMHFLRMPNLSMDVILERLNDDSWIDFTKLPLLKDNRDTGNMCSVRNCESIEVERHHWAPTHIFGHASDDWPQNYLCRYHHNQWHAMTKTGLYSNKKNRDSTL